MKKIVCVILCAVLLCSPAAALPEMGELTAKSAVLCDENGTILYEKNGDEPLQPASVTKIMTMLLVMEAVDSGQAAWEDLVTGSAYASSMGGTQIWLKEGEQLTLDEMMKAIAVGSANDCAVAVAEHLAGTETAFVERMNTRAAELGCTNTKFINANGLDAAGEKTLTSARDLALISCELLRHPDILKYTTIWMDTIRGGAFTLANTNKMLRRYNGLIGLKTGYISEAGFCISAAAEREEMRMIAVVMAAPTKDDRMADATKLLNYGFANFAAYKPDLTEWTQPIAVDMGKQDTVALRTEEIRQVVVEKEKIDGVTVDAVLPERLEAPVAAGEQVGTITVRNGSEVLCTIPVEAAESVERLEFSDVFIRLCRELLGKREEKTHENFLQIEK